jgi:hypothetical protein
VVGGSQGGLLVGTAITQRPELFNAAIIQVPLFDMLRYHKMGGAGASWIGEYGDPDKPEQRAWIEGYSPYQKLVAGKTYPTPFILTSTKDDRVHPGHARRAAARLNQLGQPYYYYENIDGGHSAAANLRESARRLALEYTYATKRLVDNAPPPPFPTPVVFCSAMSRSSFRSGRQRSGGGAVQTRLSARAEARRVRSSRNASPGWRSVACRSEAAGGTAFEATGAAGPLSPCSSTRWTPRIV